MLQVSSRRGSPRSSASRRRSARTRRLSRAARRRTRRRVPGAEHSASRGVQQQNWRAQRRGRSRSPRSCVRAPCSNSASLLVVPGGVLLGCVGSPAAPRAV